MISSDKDCTVEDESNNRRRKRISGFSDMDKKRYDLEAKLDPSLIHRQIMLVIAWCYDPF